MSNSHEQIGSHSSDGQSKPLSAEREVFTAKDLKAALKGSSASTSHNWIHSYERALGVKVERDINGMLRLCNFEMVTIVRARDLLESKRCTNREEAILEAVRAGENGSTKDQLTKAQNQMPWTKFAREDIRASPQNTFASEICTPSTPFFNQPSSSNAPVTPTAQHANGRTAPEPIVKQPLDAAGQLLAVESDEGSQLSPSDQRAKTSKALAWRTKVLPLVQKRFANAQFFTFNFRHSISWIRYQGQGKAIIQGFHFCVCSTLLVGGMFALLSLIAIRSVYSIVKIFAKLPAIPAEPVIWVAAISTVLIGFLYYYFFPCD